MAYKKTFAEYSEVPKHCPTCDNGRKDAAAIALHNLKASIDGCRSYGTVRRA